MFGLVSTQELYLCELKTIVGFKDEGLSLKKIFSEESSYVIAKSSHRKTIFTDIFTNREYKNVYMTFGKGQIAVYKANPIQTKKMFISTKVLKEILLEKMNEDTKTKKLTRES